MNEQRLKVFINRSVFADRYEVRIGARINDSVPWAVAQTMQFKVQENDSTYDPEPCFSMSRDDAQRFIDELWNVGIRPSEGSGSAGAMAAKEAHLQDMRKLVFTEKEQGPRPT